MSALRDSACHKLAFASPQKAMQHAGNGRITVRPYHCTHCGEYHLTSKETVPARKRAAMDTRRAGS